MQFENTGGKWLSAFLFFFLSKSLVNLTSQLNLFVACIVEREGSV